jgi:PBP1b-binding outer membrane lipoprotein LpoB
MESNRHKFAEDITGFALIILSILLVVIFLSSCSQTQHGFDYKKHAKSNAQWKKKAEHNKLPKCNRH